MLHTFLLVWDAVFVVERRDLLLGGGYSAVDVTISSGDDTCTVGKNSVRSLVH